MMAAATMAVARIVVINVFRYGDIVSNFGEDFEKIVPDLLVLHSRASVGQTVSAANAAAAVI